MGSKDDVFQRLLAETAPTEGVAVGGVTLTVRGLTAAEWDRYEAACVTTGDGGDKPGFRADRPLLLRLAVVEPVAGGPLFSDDDLPRLAQLPARVVNPVAAAVMRLSGATREAAETIEKN